MIGVILQRNNQQCVSDTHIEHVFGTNYMYIPGMYIIYIYICHTVAIIRLPATRHVMRLEAHISGFGKFEMLKGSG